MAMSVAWWQSVDKLKYTSLLLAYSSLVLAILAATSTLLRVFVDRQVSHLSSHAQKIVDETRAQAQQELQSKLDAARNAQAETEQRLLVTTDQLAKVEERTRSRHLTTEQRDNLISAATKIKGSLPKILVTASLSNHEAQEYGTEIVRALAVAGCAADLALPIPGVTPDVQGVHIGIRDPHKYPPEAIALGTVLENAHIPFSMSPIKPDFFRGTSFVLVIGKK